MGHLLTADQLGEFEEQGFVVPREFVAAEAIDELAVGYDLATHGEYDVDGWNLKVGRGGALQLGNPSQHIPSWKAHPYRLRIVNAGRELLGDDINDKYDQLTLQAARQ